MTQTTSTASTPTRRPKLGALAIVVGILGLLLSLAGIGGAVVGRSWAGDRLDELADAARSGLEKAVSVSDEAITALQNGSDEVTTIATTASTLAQSTTVADTAISALQEKLAPLSQRYTELRDRVVVFQEKANSVIETVQRLDRLIPGLELPSGPTDLLQGVGDRLTQIDQSITDMQARAASRTGAQETANVIAVSAGRLQDGITKATDVVTQIQEKLVAMQDRVDKAADRLDLYVTAGAAVFGLFWLWIAILNLGLIALGRRWRA